MKSCKHAWIGGLVVIFIGALYGAACTSSVVVEDGTAGAGADDSASSGHGQGGFGGECAGILGLRTECPPECEDKRVLCHFEKGPVEEEGPGVELCTVCKHCSYGGYWYCTYGS